MDIRVISGAKSSEQNDNKTNNFDRSIGSTLFCLQTLSTSIRNPLESHHSSSVLVI